MLPERKMLLITQKNNSKNLKMQLIHNIMETPLEIGTKVMLKSLKLQPKLNELYIGPYSVHKQTKNKNYILINSKHELLRESVPLSRLKVMPNDPTYYNIERILKDLLKNGIR
jgi:hypothetical protein